MKVSVRTKHVLLSQKIQPRRSIYLWMIIPMLFLNSCLGQSTSFDETQVTREVSQLFDQYIEAVNSGNALEIPTFFSDDQAFYWVEDGLKVYSDKKAMIASLESFTKDVSEVSMQVGELSITPVSSEVASLFTTYNQRMQFANGFELALAGAITITLKKEGGNWRFFNGHSSTKKPRGR